MKKHSKKGFFKKFSPKTTLAKRNKNISSNSTDALLSSDSPFYIKEAYKALRTNLIFSLPSNGCKIIAVTSALASEGKSTNCLNMAISFAEMNAKVLVIDCDLRRPNIAKMLKIKNSPGLSNLLVGLSKPEDVIRSTEYPTLFCIPAGDIPPNPVELLSSDNMGSLIKRFEKEYDYIFIDTPPTSIVIDNVVMAKYVDGVVVVVLQNSTNRESLKYAVNQLEFANSKILGFILNGVPVGNKGAYAGVKKNRYLTYFSD